MDDRTAAVAAYKYARLLDELVKKSHAREISLRRWGLPLMWIAGFLIGFGVRGLLGW